MFSAVLKGEFAWRLTVANSFNSELQHPAGASCAGLASVSQLLGAQSSELHSLHCQSVDLSMAVGMAVVDCRCAVRSTSMPDRGSADLKSYERMIYYLLSWQGPQSHQCSELLKAAQSTHFGLLTSEGRLPHICGAHLPCLSGTGVTFPASAVNGYPRPKM